MEIKLDRIVYQYETVNLSLWKEFTSLINYLETNGLISEVQLVIGQGKSQYHYNFHIGRGDGAIFIGYKHNNSSSLERFNGELCFNMKVEFNPRKLDKGKEQVIHTIQSVMTNKPCKVTMMDFALDVPTTIENVFISSLTGKTRNMYQGTVYYGQKGNNGRLKVYDKKKERERVGEKIISAALTRIEYTWKNKEGIYVDRLKDYKPFGINQEYLISEVKDQEKIKAEIKAYLFALENGIIQEKDLTRTNRNKIKTVMEEQKKIDFDSLVGAKWNEIYSEIYDLCINSYTNYSISG